MPVELKVELVEMVGTSDEIITLTIKDDSKDLKLDTEVVLNMNSLDYEEKVRLIVQSQTEIKGFADVPLGALVNLDSESVQTSRQVLTGGIELTLNCQARST